MMKIRDELNKKAKKSNSPDDWNQWRRIKNFVNKMIRKEKKNVNVSEIKEIEGERSAKSIWNFEKKSLMGLFTDS